MKIKTMIFLMAAVLLFTSGCYFRKSPEVLPRGKYVMQGTVDKEWSWVLLEDANQFVFNRNLGTSYRPMGTYAVENNKLILKANNKESYKFKIENQLLIFESGSLAEGLIEIGAVFELIKE